MTYNAYSNYGPKWCEDIIDALNGVAFEIGIASDKKRRGEAVNVDVMDSDHEQGLFVLQVRQARFRPGRFTRVRKDYFLCGKNENGNTFAHPVEVRATNANVTTALCRIWHTTPSVLAQIIRQGDVAVIPVRGLKVSECEELPVMSFTVSREQDSHVFTPRKLYSRGSEFYVAGAIQIRHEKGQHPFVSAALKPGKLYRVQVGERARIWGFARPTAD